MCGLWYMVYGLALGCRLKGLGFGLKGFGYRERFIVKGLGYEFRVTGLGLRV
jgi:hypothetical protein